MWQLRELPVAALQGCESLIAPRIERSGLMPFIGLLKNKSQHEVLLMVSKSGWRGASDVGKAKASYILR